MHDDVVPSASASLIEHGIGAVRIIVADDHAAFRIKKRQQAVEIGAFATRDYLPLEYRKGASQE